jgi:hypothetical protein
MNIEFEYIEIQNFKSIGELQVFNFKELVGLNYIFGTNLDTVESRNRSAANRHIGLILLYLHYSVEL